MDKPPGAEGCEFVHEGARPGQQLVNQVSRLTVHRDQLGDVEVINPEAAARVYDLRAKGYRVITNIQPEVVFRGRIRRNAALYSLGVPEWIAPESQEGGAK